MLIITAHSSISSNNALVFFMCVRVAILALLFNVHQLFLRKLLPMRRYRLYAGLLALSIVGAGTLAQATRVWYFGGGLEFWTTDILREVLASGIFFMMVMGVVFFVMNTRHQCSMQEARHEARALQASAELRILQAQVNPHFLFNTLHSLYSLISMRTEESQSRAQEVVLMLADLMRYTYQTAHQATVHLSQEIETIDRYIALHRVRLGKRAAIGFNSSGPVEQWQIPPLMLLTFVENAVKHGLETSAKDARLSISLEAGEMLRFRVVNTKGAAPAFVHCINPDHAEGSHTGLDNVRRRLELLYPGEYELFVEDHDCTFTVDLTLRSRSTRNAA